MSRSGTASSEIQSLPQAAVDEVMKFLVGNEETTKKIMACIMASGHVLLQDFPGTGKTFLAKILSSVLGLSYSRIQFTPDLLPSDIIGTKVWQPNTGKFTVVKGPLFANLILADEINRAPPKTQAALLEAMEERQATIEGETIPLPSPFIVIATQNPIEFEGTYPLPEAQLDRFMIMTSLGYPDDDIEVLKRRISWQKEDPSREASKIMDGDSIESIRDHLESQITVSDEILQYIALFAKCRRDGRILAGPSPRAIVSLFRMSRAMALVKGRDYVIPDDVKAVSAAVLAHRILLRQELLMEDMTAEKVLEEFTAKLPVPK
ncbi:MAG: MoxR family ATPase [Candidatus Thermoplasmatota archaeon]|jgi:MoxR-like ATPase|nr:MoxR family ATPase [Candidatus Thermoplasmatota archaeon]MCL5785757.1 MoxR family ATPase [Candidatus Thermoplasmatota archaeon]